MRLDITSQDTHWWPNSGTFEVVIGAILTQQTKWTHVEQSLKNLHDAKLVYIDALASVDVDVLSSLIKPSGFYVTKASRLKQLAVHMQKDFADFETFANNVSREWLLAQKGIGQESADAILCYGCYRDVMVCDRYTSRLLDAFGYEFESYELMQEWLEEGVESYIDANKQHLTYALFHGMIVEYMKVYSKRKKVEIKPLQQMLQNLPI